MTDALYQPFPIVAGRRAQVWQHRPDHRRPRHFHPEPELNLVVAGRASFGFGDAKVEVGAGDLLFWRPGQDHELLDASADLDLFVVALTPELSARVLGHGRSPHHGPVRIRVADWDRDAMRALCVAPIDSAEPSAVEGHVAVLWQRAHALRSRPGAMHALTDRVLASLMVQPHLGRGAIASLARGYPSEVSRHFHADMGTTLSAYRSRVRLVRFIEAVDRGAPTLLAAAFAAGFGSYSQCHRVFVRTLGCTPREFFDEPAREAMGNALCPLAASVSR